MDSRLWRRLAGRRSSSPETHKGHRDLFEGSRRFYAEQTRKRLIMEMAQERRITPPARKACKPLISDSMLGIPHPTTPERSCVAATMLSCGCALWKCEVPSASIISAFPSPFWCSNNLRLVCGRGRACRGRAFGPSAGGVLSEVLVRFCWCLLQSPHSARGRDRPAHLTGKARPACRPQLKKRTLKNTATTEGGLNSVGDKRGKFCVTPCDAA